MKSKTKIKKEPKDLKKTLDDLKKNMSGASDVKVGLPLNSNAYPDGTSVIMVGVVHEFGDEELGIPERSFLRAMLKENTLEFKALFKRIGLAIATGKVKAEKALKLLGQTGMDKTKKKITDLKSPPLKYRKGIKNEPGETIDPNIANPLVNTEHLRDSITYKVSDD